MLFVGTAVSLLFKMIPLFPFAMMDTIQSNEVRRHQLVVFVFSVFSRPFLVENVEKPSHTNFYINRFMEVRDMAE